MPWWAWIGGGGLKWVATRGTLLFQNKLFDSVSSINSVN